ncbi:hypothetical protein P7C70_g8168, partial [Phenoliferia sp. Uapishka_3]
MITTLGTALLDSFEWEKEAGKKPRTRETRIGGGGVFWSVGARIWLRPGQVGQLIHRGADFPANIQAQLDSFGPMWHEDDWRSVLRAPHATTFPHLRFIFLDSSVPPDTPSFVLLALALPQHRLPHPSFSPTSPHLRAYPIPLQHF